MTAKKTVKKEAPKEEPQFAHPEGHVKCVNCEVWLPKGTGVCPNCSYRQPHPGWK